MNAFINAVLGTVVILMVIAGMATWFLQTRSYKTLWFRWVLRLMPFVIFIVIYLWQVL